MELIPINESKIKIMLDESDMKEYNIGDEADCANSETRLAIRHILDRAKDQIGFNTEGSEIFVQLYTSKRGGCELFVTKSTISSDAIVASTAAPEKKIKKRGESNIPKALPNSHTLPARIQGAQKPKRTDVGKAFFSFDDLSSLCKVCALLEKMHLSIDGSAHKGDDGLYYLCLEGDDLNEYARLNKITFILEYGERERGYDTSTYIEEHSTPICRANAIGTLSQF